MGFFFFIYTHMKEFRSVCCNPWCKAQFSYTERDYIKVDGELREPKTCRKCKSFDTELSGGVEWTDKTYEGPRVDNQPHEIRYKVTNFKL